jgi:hypothetical protein
VSAPIDPASSTPAPTSRQIFSGTVAVASAGSPDAAGTPGSSAPAPSAPEAVSTRPHTRIQGGVRKPKVYTDGTIHYGCLAIVDEPGNLEEALKNTDWKSAMDAEYNALIKK